MRSAKTLIKYVARHLTNVEKKATNVEINAMELLKTLKAVKKANFAACQLVKGKVENVAWSLNAKGIR